MVKPKCESKCLIPKFRHKATNLSDFSQTTSLQTVAKIKSVLKNPGLGHKEENEPINLKESRREAGQERKISSTLKVSPPSGTPAPTLSSIRTALSPSQIPYASSLFN